MEHAQVRQMQLDVDVMIDGLVFFSLPHLDTLMFPKIVCAHMSVFTHDARATAGGAAGHGKIEDKMQKSNRLSL